MFSKFASALRSLQEGENGKVYSIEFVIEVKSEAKKWSGVE